LHQLRSGCTLIQLSNSPACLEEPFDRLLFQHNVFVYRCSQDQAHHEVHVRFRLFALVVFDRLVKVV
jgi:hypothetical protein